MDAIAYTLAGMAAILMMTLWLLKKKKLDTSPLPGPSTLEAFKCLLNTASTTGLHITAYDWAETYGDVVALKLPGQSIVFLNDADLIKDVFSSELNKKLANDRQCTFSTKFVFDNASLGFIPAGLEHSRLRRLFHASLRTYGEGVEAFEYEIQRELDTVVSEIEGQACINLEQCLSTSLMNCIHTLLIGKRANRGDASLSAMLDFNNAMSRLLRYELDATLTMFPFLRLLPGYYKDVCDSVRDTKSKLMQHFFDHVKSSADMDSGRGFIYNLLTIQHEGSEGKRTKVTDQDIKCFILDFLNAGYVTTRGALLGTMLCLLNHQDVQEKLHAELAEKLGSREMTVDDQEELPYLNAVIIECLRYTSHTPFSIPHLTRGDIQTRGYVIPKGSLVVASLWRIHHDERVYEDPWEFRPERFLDCAGNLLPKDHPSRRKFMLFGIGKRQCPGESFAKSRLLLYVAKLVQAFKFLPPEGTRLASADPRTWRPGVILHLPDILCRPVRR